MKQAKIIFPYRFSGMNEYSKAQRINRFQGGSMKKNETLIAKITAQKQCKELFTNPVEIWFLWVEPNRKRDPDNIAAAKKFILDGLVSAGIILNDTQKYIRAFRDEFSVDKENPRVELIIMEVEHGK